jgi:hypothetical protein
MRADQPEHHHPSGASSADACGCVFDHDAAPEIDA